VIENLQHYAVATFEWFVNSVLAPVLAFVHDYPYVVGAVLVVVIGVVVFDVAREEQAAVDGDEDAATEALWAARR